MVPCIVIGSCRGVLRVAPPPQKNVRDLDINFAFVSSGYVLRRKQILFLAFSVCWCCLLVYANVSEVGGASNVSRSRWGYRTTEAVKH